MEIFGNRKNEKRHMEKIEKIIEFYKYLYYNAFD